MAGKWNAPGVRRRKNRVKQAFKAAGSSLRGGSRRFPPYFSRAVRPVSAFAAFLLLVCTCMTAIRGELGGRGVLEERAAAACFQLLFPAVCLPGDGFQAAGVREESSGPFAALSLERLIVSLIERETAWYGMAEQRQERQIQPDPAYRRCLKDKELAGEYRRLAEVLSASEILSSQCGLLTGDGSSGWSPAELIAANPAGKEGTSLENGWIQGAGASWGEGEAEEERGRAGEKKAAETGSGAGTGKGAFPDAAQLGTTAGLRLLERSGHAVTGTTYLTEQLADYDYLMKHFYTVHPTAAAGRDMMKADAFLAEDFSLAGSGGGPQILIYHSHSQEEFADYHTGNGEATIVGVGEYLAELLRKKGYQVIHDVSVYDLKNGKLDRSKAYTYALEGISRILEENPSVEVVLDIHRDGVAEGTRLVREINGKPTAQIMFFNGTSQTPDGPISYLENPNREKNLAFSFQLKLCADALYPGYTRNIYLKGLRYNLHVRPRSALIEVGAQTNTYEEARNAMEPLAELLDTVLKPAGAQGRDS